jgi:hypothetical protein
MQGAGFSARFPARGTALILARTNSDDIAALGSIDQPRGVAFSKLNEGERSILTNPSLRISCLSSVSRKEAAKSIAIDSRIARRQNSTLRVEIIGYDGALENENSRSRNRTRANNVFRRDSVHKFKHDRVSRL